MTHWGPTYHEMTYKPTAEDLERAAKTKRRQEVFPNVGLETDKDSWENQWGIRNKKTGKVIKIIDRDLIYEYGPMGSLKLPDTHEIVTRTLWPEPWDRYPW